MGIGALWANDVPSFATAEAAPNGSSVLTTVMP